MPRTFPVVRSSKSVAERPPSPSRMETPSGPESAMRASLPRPIVPYGKNEGEGAALAAAPVLRHAEGQAEQIVAVFILARERVRTVYPRQGRRGADHESRFEKGFFVFVQAAPNQQAFRGRRVGRRQRRALDLRAVGKCLGKRVIADPSGIAVCHQIRRCGAYQRFVDEIVSPRADGPVFIGGIPDPDLLRHIPGRVADPDCVRVRVR